MRKVKKGREREMETGEWEKGGREREKGHTNVETGRCKLGGERCSREAEGQRKISE